MTKYLVAVEHPTGYEDENIKVTNDVEGFGPSLLTIYPIRTVEACQPQEAAYQYAKEFGLTNMLVRINLPDNSEEWWMRVNELHKIDTGVEPVWEPDEKYAGELDRFLAEVTAQYQSTRKDGGDYVDAVADVLVSEGYVIVKAEEWQDMCDKQPERGEATIIEILPSVLETCMYFAKRLKELGEDTNIAKWFELAEIDKERDNAYWVLGSILAELLEDAGLVPGEEGPRTSTTGAAQTMHLLERECRIRSQGGR